MEPHGSRPKFTAKTAKNNEIALPNIGHNLTRRSLATVPRSRIGIRLPLAPIREPELSVSFDDPTGGMQMTPFSRGWLRITTKLGRYSEPSKSKDLYHDQKTTRQQTKVLCPTRAWTITVALSDSIELVMVRIPGKDYWMGKFPVTQAQWEAVMGENPSDDFKGADHPVENVSWDDCQVFLKTLNATPAVQASGLVFRLPKEDEWEYACRADAEGDYCKLADGTEITEETLDEVAWFDDNSGDETHPVGQKKPNAFGLYDMHGNVWEWTNTAVGRSRVGCGGSWNDSAGYCEPSNLSWLSPDCRNCDLGFRLCASARAASNDGSASRK